MNTNKSEVEFFEGNNRELENLFLQQKSGNRFRCILMFDGMQMKTYEGFFSEFSEALSFPAYFGKNMNAFIDCMEDLSWLSYEGYFIIIQNFATVLSEEVEVSKESIIEVLTRISNFWNNPYDIDKPWGHEPISFKFLLHRWPC
jgi:RNAse (barnase) inhibitor barstar